MDSTNFRMFGLNTTTSQPFNYPPLKVRLTFTASINRSSKPTKNQKMFPKNQMSKTRPKEKE